MSSNSQSSSRVQPKPSSIFQQTPDPYDLVRRLSKELKDMKTQIEEYELAFNSLEQ